MVDNRTTVSALISPFHLSNAGFPILPPSMEGFAAGRRGHLPKILERIY
jgi:hypothetical protein